MQEEEADVCKMVVVFAMGLLALGMEAAAERTLPVPDASRFTKHDVQATREAGDDLQAPWLEGQIQAP
jgi:hypothetical protein